ncbi:SRSF protein kinase 2-like isoform X1 [Atheta coriaria]|uniref:SRSF protein kinase 2-like isoform X1 n=1 Tax=Dalotia coriaria TaxID=877792 RepID=UPI0031F3E15A
MDLVTEIESKSNHLLFIIHRMFVNLSADVGNTMSASEQFCPADSNAILTNTTSNSSAVEVLFDYDKMHDYFLIFFSTFVLHFIVNFVLETVRNYKVRREKPAVNGQSSIVANQVENVEIVRQPTPRPRIPKVKSGSAPKLKYLYLKNASRGKPPSEYTEEDLRVMPSDQNGSQENVFEYRTGGYKPTAIGEELGDYTVIRKLGFGHFSTVWLCSHKLEREKYVAVKVVKSVHMCANMAREEIKLLNQLVNIEPKHEGRKYIIEMMDYYHVNSVNGKHICIAFELMGPSLLHLITQSQYQGIYEGAVKSIIRQVLMGLTYLHDKCKVIHTDLKPENILIKVNDAYIKNMVDKATRYNELGIPMPRSYITSECYESQSFESHVTNSYVSPEYDGDHVVRSSSFPRLSDLTTIETEVHHGRRGHSKKELYVSPKIEVKIADMGNACWTNDKIQGTIQTKQYRALEVLLDSDYDLPADIWSVGCIAFELSTGEFLFNPRNTQNYSASEDHILLIYELLGGIPSYISSRGRKSSRYFDSTGNLKICPLQLLHIWKTEDVLVEKYDWKRVDAIPFASMINAMIEPDPELRVTAENALQMQWLKEASTHSVLV